MKPAIGRSSVSIAFSSETFVSSMETIVPGTRSRLTMRMPPMRSHSTRICRSGTSCADSVTRPLAMVSVSGPAADTAGQASKPDDRQRADGPTCQVHGNHLP